jgi:preprotein translocase subunit SecE
MAKSMAKEPPKPIPAIKNRRGPKGFFTDVIRELKKVDWPPAREVNRLTGVVLVVCALVVAILWGMSEVASTIVSLIQGKG